MLKHLTIRLSFLIIVVLALSSCATSGLTNAELTQAYVNYISTEKLEKIDRITVFRFQGWGSLGDEHLIISTHINRPYLITLRSRCAELRYTQVIRINNRDLSLDAKFDSISVPHSRGFKCYIKSIHKLSPEQRKAMAKLRKKTDDSPTKVLNEQKD